MPRNITVTFVDGSSHVYNNAPDNITPDQVAQRAQQDFGKQVAHLDGGRVAQPAPSMWQQLKNATVNTVAGIGQSITALPDAAANAAGAAMGYTAHYGGEAAGAIADAIGANGDHIRNTADKYATVLEHPWTPGGAIERAAPTPQDTAGKVVRFGSQLIGAPLAGAAVPAAGGLIENGVARMAGITPRSIPANALSNIVNPQPVQPNIGTRIVTAAKNLVGSADGTGARLVAQKLAEDNVAPADAAAQMTAASANGQPMMLADMGDNTRALAADMARQPGAARDIGLNAVRERQIGDNPFGQNTVPSQSERVQTAITRDLGPVTDPIAASEALSQQGKAAAAPLYDKAYANDGASVFYNEVQDLLQRPSMQKALQNAGAIAAEEGRNPNSLGLSIGPDGLFSKIDKPTWQTWDYIKRGLDDVVESYRDPTTGKLNLDTQGRAVNNTLRDFLGRIDQANPDYAAARQAYAGPAAMRTALNDGADALNWSANRIRARMGDMSDAEKDQFWLGLRSAISDKAAATNDGVNVVRNLVGSGAKRDALATAAGGKSNVENFMRSLDREQTMNSTYAKVTGGSPTYANALEGINNSSLIANDAASHFGRGGGIKEWLVNHGVRQVQGAIRYGTGQAGQRAREDAAALLFTPNPNDFMQAMRQTNTATQAANTTGRNALAGAVIAGARQGAISNDRRALAIQGGQRN